MRETKHRSAEDIKDLRDWCMKRGLPAYGQKADLIKRLQRHDGQRLFECVQCAQQVADVCTGCKHCAHGLYGVCWPVMVQGVQQMHHVLHVQTASIQVKCIAGVGR